MRPTKEDMANSVHRPLKTNLSDLGRKIFTYHDMYGEVTTVAKQAVLQLHSEQGMVVYKAWANNRNQLYRPNDVVYATESQTLGIQMSQPPYRFITVSKEVYDLYLIYLQTKRLGFVEKAERLLC